MPLIHRAFDNGRPMISAIVGVSEPKRVAMVSAGLTPPSSVVLNLLIDTGASGTALDPDALASLNLTPTGAIFMQTPSTGASPVMCNQYDVSLIIPAVKGAPFVIDAQAIIEASLRSQGFDGLLGRDVLQQCVLFYNSPLGGYTLAY